MQISGTMVAQMFDTEGVSYLTYVNGTAELRKVQAISGNIYGGSSKHNSLEYEFEDSGYRWNQIRDLKAREPFLAR